MDDLISKQAAIDLYKKYQPYLATRVWEFGEALKQLPPAQPEPSTEIQEILNYLDTTLHPIVSPNNWNVYAELHDMVSRLPSAKPEPLTDKEQRIFFAAMGREKEICKKTDEECRNCREPYEDSLVRVCNEIVRKVKGALWQT